ncbi:50S ribosomal protein L10 [Candidatus Hodgkinia cicadicola]|nr:50S ribosomal protein L10 [Candidatus Hodgkinia cicadicola]PIM96288.1 50S ribosomal protein L10 [Candidatus Hodgkinia cicadicola]
MVLVTSINKFDFEYSILTNFKSFIVITSDNIDHNSFYRFKRQLYPFDSLLIKIKNSHSKILLNKVINNIGDLSLPNIINESCMFIVFDELTFELWHVINNFIKLYHLNLLLFISRNVVIDKQNLTILTDYGNNKVLRDYFIQQLKQVFVRFTSGLKHVPWDLCNALKSGTNYK